MATKALSPLAERLGLFPKRIAVDLRDKPGFDCQFGVVQPGVTGYVPIHSPLDLDTIDEIVCEQHNTRKPTEAERAAAYAGSLFGWNVPLANPTRYTEDGVLINEKR